MTLTEKKSIDYRDRIIVALDVKSKTEALELLARLENQVKFVKVGMELFYAEGYPLIELLKKRNLRIFLDLKMHDIPNTVGRTTAQLTRLGVDMFNLHVAGGSKMMEEARNQMERALIARQERPLLIGVTQLTSTDERILREEIGIAKSVKEIVLHYAKLAKKSGLDGVVSSALEVKSVKEACGPSFLTVTPGIRLAGESAHDQKRITTPKQAINLGSDYLVIGRSITKAENPAKTFETIVNSLNKLSN
ncbi:orotidine 5'-phosphate decarboxylase [Vulcanibacillus modesticaldus]|uniref:Orotidine 5'-phosphate decarboxylase n=1 Tax=Vulcanibacillus modesticaldus TaxID=337097 RepID=A0A1D2YTS7_9BACI|nr:orotidine-5'-phosphate decarboxylase [Vulcanibacillus modesticaldus]OEF99098.1 orotidine 5'-phosphate decarboxylase [Vulcanibacillus modesticaldus]